METNVQFLALLVEQQNSEDLVVNDFAHQLRHPPKRGIEIERGVDHVGYLEQERFHP